MGRLLSRVATKVNGLCKLWQTCGTIMGNMEAFVILQEPVRV
jgi:hypothetical protein